MSMNREEAVNHGYSQVRQLIDPLKSNMQNNSNSFNGNNVNGLSNAHKSNSDISISNTSMDESSSNQTTVNDYESNGDSNSIILKNNHRTKLTSQDVRLILYLTINIKPFKYVGDRSLSQTKKWEIIQTKFAEIKRKNSDGYLEVIVPTVRTLQRQLATAIKKAKLRRQNNKGNKENKNLDSSYFILSTINKDSSLNDLELALLELNDLSEKLKTGKGTNTPVAIELPNANILQSFDLNKSITSPIETSNVSANIPTANSTPNNAQFATSSARLSSKSSSLILNVNDTYNNIRKTMSDNSSSYSQQNLYNLLEKLLNEYTEFQIQQQKENTRIIEDNIKFIKEQNERCNKIIESNNRFQKEQNDLNKQLILEVINTLSQDSNSSISNKSALKSFHDLL
ncbi:unnamed protein product [Debaryomyces tyrocola]|nr:unnamed protein product [Debaryomyces tyrocola]